MPYANEERSQRLARMKERAAAVCRAGAMVALLAHSASALAAADGYENARQAMLAAVRATAADTRDYTGLARFDDRVMGAMAAVPRHEFVPPALREVAYLNRPLPIGEGQTISQPYIVALMTQLAGVEADDVVLEVGTGSGYQAAVLAQLVRHVYSVEIVEALGQRAKQTLARLGVGNVSVKIGDGYQGWAEHAPYDAIVVTAAPAAMPPRLLEQLKPGARLVAPVGPQHRAQSLRVLEKKAEGGIEVKDILPVAFVPMVHPDE